MPHELPSLTHLADWHDRLPRYAWAAQLAEGKRVLDLGCGTADGAAMLVAAGAREVVAVDPRAELIAEARRRHDSDRLEFVHRPIDADLRLDAATDDESDSAEAFDAQSTSVLLRAVSPPAQHLSDDQLTTELQVVDADASATPEHDHHGDADEPEHVEREHVEREHVELDAPFDLVLALDTRLPLGQVEFLEALAARLAPGGQIVAALRLDATATLGDVLVTLEHGRRSTAPVAPGRDGARAHLETVFGSVRFVGVTPRLTVSLEPEDADPEHRSEWRPQADEEDSEASRPVTSLVVLARDGADSSALPAVDCVLDLPAVTASLSGSASALLARTLGSEHGTLVLEEQLSQKEALVDDLEREVRAADGRRREVEAQLVRLREELDELQGELTEPRAIVATTELELQRAVEDRDRALSHIDEQRRHAEAVAARLHEAVEAQRVTIDALRTRLQLAPLEGVPTLSEASTATERVESPAASEDLEAARARIKQLERELERRANALDESRESAEEARQNLDEACTELSTLRRANEALAAREQQGRGELETALSSERERRAEVEHHAHELERQLEQAQARLAELETALEVHSQERTTLEKQLGRFRRTRRARRGAEPDRDGAHRRELEVRDARIAELEVALASLRARSQAATESLDLPPTTHVVEESVGDDPPTMPEPVAPPREVIEIGAPLAPAPQTDTDAVGLVDDGREGSGDEPDATEVAGEPDVRLVVDEATTRDEPGPSDG